MLIEFKTGASKGLFRTRMTTCCCSLSQAGVPLEIPEIYYCQSMGDAVGMARNQIGGYDEVRDEAK